MPTIRQLIQTSPAKATELFTKLAETSGNAVKTRERFFPVSVTWSTTLRRMRSSKPSTVRPRWQTWPLRPSTLRSADLLRRLGQSSSEGQNACDGQRTAMTDRPTPAGPFGTADCSGGDRPVAWTSRQTLANKK